MPDTGNYTPPNTGDALAAMDADSIRKLWQKTVDMHEQNEDFLGKFEGRSRDSMILTETRTSAGKGQELTITNRSGFYGEGKSGDSLFQPEDFEEIEIGSYKVKVDWLRNATSSNERMEEVMGMRDELRSGDAAELGKWMGREKSYRLMMLWRERGDTETLLRANGRFNDASIVSGDVLDYDFILEASAYMEPLGGRPAKVGNINGNPVHRFGVLATSQAMFSLEADDDYKTMLEAAGNRGDTNYLFTGGYPDVRGNYFMKFNPIRHDGTGPIGCPLAPEAVLGIAITAGTSVIEVTGGGSTAAANKTQKKYFKFFDNYAFEFLPGDVISPSSEEKYFLIVNPPNAPTDANKIGMYAYTTGNNGNRITITKRLGPTDAGAQSDKIGDVEWNTGVWADRHTQVHPAGARIIQCNAKGVPIVDTIMLGAMAAIRGYGKYRNHRSDQSFEGGFVYQRFITSVFGQDLRKDRLGRCRGFVRLRHAAQYPGLPLPTVT